ncbi:hypothetical protein JB92DRAFT_2897112 [Gautieria morchelliformis]|nr:hypothetical protein JB92DRAFT_2897112 [Gautieria morchelliformis]
MIKAKLPRELIDAIIDEFREDRDSLLIFSLVDRTCLSSSQRHLFRTITLYVKAPGERLSLTERLGQVLLTSPHLAHYIQELELLPSADWKTNFLETEKALPLLLRKLSNLRRIVICSLLWTTITPDLKEALHWVLMLPSMTSIRIQLGRFDRVDELADLLYLAQDLKSLELYDIRTVGPWHPLELWTLKEDVRDDQRGHLSDLQLCFGDFTVLFALLLGPRSPWKVSHIQTLQIRSPAREYDVDRLLRTIGSSLKHFRLDMFHDCRHDRPREPGWAVNMEFNSNIQSLCLANIHISSIAITTLSTQLQRIFSNVNASNLLEQLRLELFFDDVEEVPADWSAWKQVDVILAGTNFGFLRRLYIEISSEVEHEPGLVYEVCNQMVAMHPLLAG